MAVVSSNPSTVVSAGAWTSAANVYASDNVYATNTGATQNTEYPFEVGGFNFSSLSAVAGDVTVTVEAKASAASRSQIKVEVLDGSTVLATRALATITTSDVSYTLTATLTLTQLQSANLKVRVTHKRINSSASTMSVDWVKIDAPAPNPKLETLTDDFTGATLNATKWPDVWDPASNTLVDGKLALPTTTAYSGVGTGTPSYDLTDSSVFVQVFPSPAAATRQFHMQVRCGANAETNMLHFTASGSPMKLYRRLRVAGTDVFSENANYDPVNDAWWKITCSGTTFTFYTSPDGVTWNQKSQTTNASLNTANVSLMLQSGWYTTDPGASTAYVDNVNVAPSGGGTVTGSASTAGVGAVFAAGTAGASNPKTETCQDTFDTQIDPAKWAPSGVYAWENGQAKLTPKSPSGYSYLRYKGLYDLNGSSFYVKIPTLPTVDTYREVGLNLHTTDLTEGAHIYLGVNSGVWWIYARDRVASTNSNSSGRAYSPVNDKWWKISKTAGTLYFHTSPDGVTWNLLWSKASTGAHTALEPWFEVGDWSTPTIAADAAYFDNVNTPEAAGVTGSASASGVGGVAAAGQVVAAGTASAAGAGTASALARQSSPASVAGVGSTAATASSLASGTASATGSAATSATARQASPATVVGVGATSAAASVRVPGSGSASGIGSTSATGSVIGGGTATAAGAGSVSGTAVQMAGSPATFAEVLGAIPGLVAYYPLDSRHSIADVKGGRNAVNAGAVTFGAGGATFAGTSTSYLEVADADGFSAATTGSLTVVAFQTVTDWVAGTRADPGGYCHWLGKGVYGSPNQYEWAFRHYFSPDISGEDPARTKRTSFYHFNADAGLGAGSYFQDDDAAGVERMVVGQVTGNKDNGGMTNIWKDGVPRDSDLLSGYSITPTNTTAPVRMGTTDRDSYFKGTLRRVAVFDRILTQSEIVSLYSARNYAEGTWSGGVPVPPSRTAVAGSGAVNASAGGTVPGSASVTGAGITGAASALRVPGLAATAGIGATSAAARLSGASAVAGAGSTTASAGVAPATVSATGTGSTTNAVAAQRAPAVVAGVGTVSANAGGQSAGVAAVAGSGTVTALARTSAPATVVGAGSDAALATQRAAASVTGFGTTSADAGGQVSGTVTVVGAGTVTTIASVQSSATATAIGLGAVTAAGNASTSAAVSAAGVGSVTALAMQRASAVVVGQGVVSATPQLVRAVQFGRAGSYQPGRSSATQKAGVRQAGATAPAAARVGQTTHPRLVGGYDPAKPRAGAFTAV